MSSSDVMGPNAGVDVAIPCYQYGRFLRDCVMSVLGQGLQDVRILIIDNASRDDSVEVAQQLAAEDRRVEVLARRRNLGRHASFNEGIDWASSKYFVLLCADDCLAPGSLARAVSVLERHPDVGFSYGRTIYPRPGHPMTLLDPNKQDATWRMVTGGQFLERACRTATGQNDQCATVARTDTQKLAGYYRTELPYSDDFEMWMRFARLGPVAVTKAVQGIMRVHESSLTVVARQARYHDEGDRLSLDLWRDRAALEMFFAHEGALLPEAAHLQSLAKRGLAERAYWSAIANLLRGQPSLSLDLLKYALRRRPSAALLPPVSYLFWRDDLIRKIIATASDLARWPGTPVSVVRASG